VAVGGELWKHIDGHVVHSPHTLLLDISLQFGVLG
jgi:hypothetical protein